MYKNETEIVFSNEFIGFTTIPNHILNDNRLSYKALGLYSQILQYQNSPTHKLYQSTLIKLKKDGRDSVISGMKELIKYGYIKKEQLKDTKNRFCGVKYTVFMKPIEVKESTSTLVNKSAKAEVGKAEVGKAEIGKADTNNKIIKNEILKKENNVSLSVVEEPKKEMTDGQTDYAQNSNNNFKIQLDDCDNEIKKTVIDISNKLLQQKTTTVANKKIDINSLIIELEKMDKETINKLIDYVVKKFEIINSDNIKNKAKYISAIFTNAILEKSYLLDDAKREISDSNYNYTKSYSTNKFLNYKQEPLDNDLIRQIEQKNLRENTNQEEIEKHLKKLGVKF